MTSLLRWIAAVLLVVALAVSVGAVMAYVNGGASLGALFAAATVAVIAFHALRRLEPRPEGAAPPEVPLADALFVVGLLGVVILVGIWNLLAGLLALVALRLFVRRAA